MFGHDIWSLIRSGLRNVALDAAVLRDRATVTRAEHAPIRVRALSA